MRFRDWLGAHAIVSLGLFAAGVAIYIAYTRSLTNRFAAIARSEHLAGFALVNLKLLPAYGLIALHHAALSYPLARRFVRRPAPRLLRLVPLAAIGAVLVLLLSLGPLTCLSTGPLDTLARLVAAAWPDADLYVFLDARLREVFTVGFVLLALAATRDLFGIWIAIARARAARRARPIRRLALAGFLVLAIGAGLPLAIAYRPDGAGIERPRKHPHVLVVASDSLRSDHLGVHGYPRPTSPNIDALAREAIDLDRCFVATASTIESWASFLTGEYPASHGLRYMFVSEEQARRVSEDAGTLPRRLEREGYETGVYGDWAANCFDVVDFGFDRTAVSKSQSLDVFMAEIALRVHPLVPLYFASASLAPLVPDLEQAVAVLNPEHRVDEFLDDVIETDRRGKPFFGVLFLSCTHLPYLVPHPYNRRFVDPAYRGGNRFRVDFDFDAFIQGGFADAQSAAERQHVIDLYDGGVAWFDAIVGRVVAELRERELLDDTILIVTSDHGDDLYEPGVTLGHGTSFLGGDQANRIPMLIRMPNAKHGGSKVERITRGIDLAPTLVELLELGGTEEAAFDGASLLPYLADADADLQLAAFAETCYLFFPKRAIDGAEVLRPADETLYIDPEFGNQFVLKPEWHDAVIRTKDRMLRTERWKLVYVPAVNGPLWRLYDMTADPRQERDLSSAGLAVFAPLKERLLDWIATGKDARFRIP